MVREWLLSPGPARMGLVLTIWPLIIVTATVIIISTVVIVTTVIVTTTVVTVITSDFVSKKLSSLRSMTYPEFGGTP